MEHKKLFMATFLIVLSGSLIAWQIGRNATNYRKSRYSSNDSTIQALLRGSKTQQEYSLIPPENSQNTTPNPNKTSTHTHKNTNVHTIIEDR